jgi:hypothetical protein
MAVIKVYINIRKQLPFLGKMGIDSFLFTYFNFFGGTGD